MTPLAEGTPPPTSTPRTKQATTHQRTTLDGRKLSEYADGALSVRRALQRVERNRMEYGAGNHRG